MKNKEDKKKLVISIIAVLLIVIVVAGGTYAYFQWTSGENERTSVNITIAAGQITMHIEPEKTVFTNLKPVSDCNIANAYGDSLVTVVNNTSSKAIPSFKLKVRVTKGGSGELTKETLSHIHYTVVPINTIIEDELPKKDNNPSCSDINRIYFSSSANNALFFKQDTSLTNHLKFESVNTDGTWSHLPNIGDYTSESTQINLDPAYLPRQYYLDNALDSDGNIFAIKESAKGVTFVAHPNQTTYQYFRVYVWIDDGYSSINAGGVINDPLQNAKIEVTWSEDSIIEQVPDLS